MKKYIANIVTKSNIEPFSEFAYITDTLDGSVDRNIPTLIVGWELTKEYFPDADILDWKIDENMYWCYSPKEKRYKFEEHYADFQKKVVKKLLEDIHYQYFNIFTSSLTDVKKVIAFLHKKKSIILVIYNMAYLLHGNKIIGFSFEDAEYIGVSKEKVMNLLRGNQLIFSNDFLDDKDKLLFSNSNIATPYLYSLTI